MSDLVAFLEARIAEDEAVAHTFDGYPHLLLSTCGLDASDEYMTIYMTPARVLAECAAKRAIVQRVSNVKWTGSYAVRDVALGLMAAVYADHADYREQWAP